MVIAFALYFLSKDNSTNEKLSEIKELEKSIIVLKEEQRKIEEQWKKQEELEEKTKEAQRKLDKFIEDNFIKDTDVSDEVDPEFIRPSSDADNNDNIIVENLKGLIVEDLYVESKNFNFKKYKEVTRNVYIFSEFNSKPLKHKIKVGNYIMCHAYNKKYDINFYKQYFDFNKIHFFYENGKSKHKILHDNTEKKNYKELIVRNDKEYTNLLNKVKKNGNLNYSLKIEVNPDQKPCLQSLPGIKKIKGDVFIMNPFFCDMGDVESVNSLEIVDFKDRPPIDLKNLKQIEECDWCGLFLKGDIKSFGKLEVINGDFDLTKCDFNGYDNLKVIKGDLKIKHKYKGLYNKPEVEGGTYHVRENNLRNIIDDGWSKDYDSHQIRRNNSNEIRASFEKVYEFVENKEFSKAFKKFNTIKYPDNIVFSGKRAYVYREKGIKYPNILRYEGYEIWLLYFYNKNIIDIDVNFILKLCGFGKLITEIGKQYIEGLMPFLEDEIKNNSPYNLNTIDFNWVEDYFIRFLEHKNKKSPYHFNHHGFEDSKYEEMRIEIDRVFEETILASENKFRESKGIKRVGEYWKNETELYYKLKELFAEEDIVQHGNPKWLGEQHLDIYFPKHNIGVEYHGEQHFKAVKVFGGEEGLEKTKERDERKRRLCKKNSCHLIEIRKDYDIDGLTKKIKTLINN